MEISIISPVYKAEKIIDELVKRITCEIQKITNDYEIILIEDGSPDNCWVQIEENCRKNDKVVGIKLSRNFGQHYAITAGIENAKGKTIVLMDCDLQDDPIFIKDLLKERDNGYDIVFTKRKMRKHSFLKSFYSQAYNKFFNIFSDRKYDVNAGSLVCFSQQVGRVFVQLKEKDRLYLQMLKWIGFNNITIEVEHKERFEGKSSYSLYKLIKLGLQGWTSHSDKLLKITSYLGFTISLFSLIIGFTIAISHFYGKLQTGWPSIIVSIFFSTGLILMGMGILGVYIGKIFEQVKDRPLFIIEKKINYGKRNNQGC